MNFAFTGQVHIQICTKISVKFGCSHGVENTNLLNKKTHQEFLDVTSDLESPAAADHGRSLKLVLYICPVLVRLLITLLETRQCIMQFFVLICCYLILGKSSCFFLFWQLFKSGNHSRMVCVCLHLNNHGILLPLHLTNIYM